MLMKLQPQQEEGVVLELDEIEEEEQEEVIH